MTRVKVCGITTLEDALRAADLGADALGFVFYPKSPRYIRPEEAAEIIRGLPPFVASVGVFVDCPPARVAAVAATCGLAAVQLHGAETPEMCEGFRLKVIKAFRIRDGRLPPEISRYHTDALLLDAFVEGIPGGTGIPFPWQAARRAKQYGRIILAGGLDCGNIRDAVETVQPYAVDVSSGVESEPGRKDPKRLAEFVAKAKIPPSRPSP